MTAPVGYVVDRFPVLSQTFVSGEVAELRRQGQPVVVTSLRRPRDEVDGHRPDLVYDDLLGQLTAARRARAVDAVVRRGAVRESRRRLAQVASEVGPLPSQFEWWAVSLLAHRLRQRGVRHLHAHFAWAAAALAYCAAPLVGGTWSMTVHANDIFSRTRNLEVKLREADALVTVCDYNRRYLQEQLGLTRSVDLVVCGVEVPERVEPVGERVDIVAVGRLVPKKGFDVLLRAVALLPPPRPTLLVIGDGAEAPRLHDLSAELGLGDAVVFAGAVPHIEALAAVASARLLCLPARIAADGDRDSMPLVVKEAMARQVPVVASDVAALPEMVDDEVGRLVPPDDPAALARALQSVLSLPEPHRAEMGRRGRQRVIDRFTLAGQTSVLLEVLNRVR